MLPRGGLRSQARLLRAREIRIGRLLRLGQRLGEREPHRGGARDAWVSLDLFEVDPP